MEDEWGTKATYLKIKINLPYYMLSLCKYLQEAIHHIIAKVLDIRPIRL